MKKIFVISMCIVSTLLIGCQNDNPINTDKNEINITSQEETHTSPFDSTNNSTETTTEQTEGEILTFSDSAIIACVYESLDIDGSIRITDKMCEKVYKLDCTGHILSTLEDLAKFPNLTELYVDNSNNELNLKGINKASKLSKITLRNCRLREVDRLADLTELEYLDLCDGTNNGTLVTDYSSLATLTNLKNLYLEGAGTADGSFINDLTNLETLDIYRSGLYNYSLETLKKLRYLNAPLGFGTEWRMVSGINPSHEMFIEQLTISGAIKNIEVLQFHGPISDGAIENNLSNATNLKELRLVLSSDCNSLSGLGNLKNLESLELDNDSTFDLPLEEYSELAKLNKLTNLFISSSPVNHDARNNPDDYKFLDDIKSLKTLNIDAFRDMRIDCFSSLNNLESLTLRASVGFTIPVDISGIEKFKSLKELKYYNVSFKSTAPLDDLDYLNVEELKPSLW